MSFKCDSCSVNFSSAVKLFEHIQQSCLWYYKSHPASWAKILSSLGSDNDGAAKSTAPKDSQPRKKDSTISIASTPSSSSSTNNSGTRSAQTRSQAPESNASIPSTSKSDDQPYICKCEALFKTVEQFREHLKVCAPGKEPPFCIMFRAQDADQSKPQKNIHMTVADYFYGSLSSNRSLKLKSVNRRFNCYSCGKALRNNIRFMSHLRHKIINEWEKTSSSSDVNDCQHCYRQYRSPFLLQCHVENVHGSIPAACTCRICELHFASERTFLFHMKDKHVHNEAPYICRVCMYRSSFYNDVIKHFREVHTDTTALMCPFCLMISYNSNAFLKHVIQHIKSNADCLRCRLKFVTVKDRNTHVQNDHLSQVMKEKLKKYKNLSKCQVYVRVSSLQLTQRQNMIQKTGDNPVPTPASGVPPLPPPPATNNSTGSVSKKRTNDELGESSSPPLAKKFTSMPSVQLPAYLSPLKRPTKIKKLRISTKYSNVTQCHECGDTFAVEELIKHFNYYHECRWCVYVTACEKASHNHVLKEHADAEMREELTGKVEKTEPSTFAAALLDEEEPSPRVKSEPMDEEMDKGLLPPTVEVKEEKAKLKLVNKSIDTAKPRRKQSNPMKIKNSSKYYCTSFDFHKNSPSPKRFRKDRKVQTKSYEKEMGSQTIEREFEAFVDEPTTSASNATQKERSRTQKSQEKSRNKTPIVNCNRKRKILAPEGFFPDIDDDAGWAKFFKDCEDKSWTSKNTKPKVSVPLDALPTMVPLSTTASIQKKQQQSTINNSPITNLNLQQNPHTPITAPGMNNMLFNAQIVNNSGLITPTQPGSSKPIPAPANVVLTKPNTLPKSTSNPVYQFQIVPNKAIPTAIAPKPATPNQPLYGLLNKVQDMLSQVPKTPVDLRCLEVTQSTLLVQWDAPSNCMVTHYKVVFQGAGAPTVQLLPPEQTLVRLVGLKSDTMYVVRVYTLCNKAVSQYAFLYQKTNKLRHKNSSATVDDVVLVLDDNDPVVTPQNTASTSITTVARPLLPLPSSGVTSTNNNTVVVNSSDMEKMQNKMQEENKKKMLINEILASFKKNKVQKIKNKANSNTKTTVGKISNGTTNAYATVGNTSTNKKDSDKTPNANKTTDNTTKIVDNTAADKSPDDKDGHEKDLQPPSDIVAKQSDNGAEKGLNKETEILKTEIVGEKVSNESERPMETDKATVAREEMVPDNKPADEGTDSVDTNKVVETKNQEEVVKAVHEDGNALEIVIDISKDMNDVAVEDNVENSTESNKPENSIITTESVDIAVSETAQVDATPQYDSGNKTSADVVVESVTIAVSETASLQNDSRKEFSKDKLTESTVETETGAADQISNSSGIQTDDAANTTEDEIIEESVNEQVIDKNTTDDNEVLADQSADSENKENVQPTPYLNDPSHADAANVTPATQHVDDCDLEFNIVNVVSLSDQSKDETCASHESDAELIQQSAEEQNAAEGISVVQDDVSLDIKVLPCEKSNVQSDVINLTGIIDHADEVAKTPEKNIDGKEKTFSVDTAPSPLTHNADNDENEKLQSPSLSLPDSPVPPGLISITVNDLNNSETTGMTDIIVIESDDPLLPRSEPSVIQSGSAVTEDNSGIIVLEDDIDETTETKQINDDNSDEKKADKNMMKEMDMIVNQQTICDTMPTLDDIRDMIGDSSWL